MNNQKSPPADQAPALAHGLRYIYPLIRQRHYAPGDRIPSERDLAARFSVSRAVIREELSVLESMRIIERRPQSGIFVREISRDGSLDALVLEAGLGLPMSAADVRSLNEFRAIIELQAVDLACERRTRDDLDRLESILAQTATLLAAGESVSDMDARFHLAVCGATQNQILVRAANSFWLASKSRRDIYFADPANGKRSLEHHQRLVAAITAQDRAAARAVMEEHLGRVASFWLGALNDANSRAQPHDSSGEPA